MGLKQQVRALLPESLITMYRRLRLVRRGLFFQLHRMFRSGPFPALYYPLLSLDFLRENRAVLAGKFEFQRRLRDQFANEYFLRRSIHRIEKGLVMEPRREVFGTAYIHDTVRAYRSLSEAADCAIDLHWAHDVLTRYFEETGQHPAVMEARRVFREDCRMSRETLSGVVSRSPYPRSQVPGCDVSIEAFTALCRRRRSVRWYQDRPVSREAIDLAFEAALQAPSACNRQPFEFRVFDDENLVRQVLAVPGGTTGWSHSPPVAMAVVGHLDAFLRERDKHLIYIDGALAAMGLMLALETVGLSSCPVNFPDVAASHQRINNLLGLKPYQSVIMLMAVGYAREDGLIPFSDKKPVAAMRSYNKTV